MSNCCAPVTSFLSRAVCATMRFVLPRCHLQRCVRNTFFLIRLANSKLLPEFLAWQINRAPAQRYLASNAEGSDQLSIRRGVLEGMPVAVPPLEQQHAIIALANDAIAEKRHFEALIHNRQRQQDAIARRLHKS